MENFYKANKFAVVEPTAAAGQTTLTGDTVDMQGFDECTFLALFGDVTDTSVLTLTVHHSDESNANFAATTCSATFTAGASDADSKAIIVSMARPTKRYLRAVLTRGTANAVVGGIVAIQSKPTLYPVTQDASVIVDEFEVSPTTA